MQSENSTVVESGVCALERLLDDEELVELAATHDNADLNVSLVSESNHQLFETYTCALTKLGKDRTPLLHLVHYTPQLQNCSAS